MAETPTFGRYAESPYDQMTPEQQEGYRSLIETRGRSPRPCRHHRRDHPDGLLHQRRDDARLLRRAGRRARHGALSGSGASCEGCSSEPC